jgi:hypothetical protein
MLVPWSTALPAFRRFLPHNYKRVLTVLEQTRTCTWPALAKFDLCKCGYVYRDQHACQQGRTCPECGAGRASSHALYYRPISDWLQCVYGDKAMAEDFATWQDRARQRVAELLAQGRSDVLTDIADSPFVRAALNKDTHFVNEPRHVYVLLVTDDFIVSCGACGARGTSPQLAARSPCLSA